MKEIILSLCFLIGMLIGFYIIYKCLFPITIKIGIKDNDHK